MSPRHITFFFAACVAAPFAAGYVLKKAGWVAEALTPRLQTANIILFGTSTVFLGVWSLDLQWRLIFLPATGVVVALAGCAYGLVVSRLYTFSRPQRGSFVLITSLANHGYTMGAMVCYVFFGIRGYSLAAMYVSFWQFLFFLVFFPIARHFGRQAEDSLGQALKRMFTDVRSLPLVGIAGGVAMSASGAELPPAGESILGVLIPVASALAFFAIGVSVRFRAIRRYVSVYYGAFLWKFALAPAASLLLVRLLGVEGLPAVVILIEGTMPVAVYATVISGAFGLDTDMTNSAFIATTAAFLFVVLPALAVAVMAT